MTKEEHNCGHQEHQANHECNCKQKEGSCKDSDCKHNHDDKNKEHKCEHHKVEETTQQTAQEVNQETTLESNLSPAEKLEKQYNDMKNTLQRVYAEFQNYKKRTEENRQKSVELSNEYLLKKIIPIMDNLELALNNNKQDDDFSKGIALIHAQFTQVLEDEGVKRILSSGKYDPKLHEVLMTEESKKEEGVILEELQKGYILGNRILRHAKVKIAKHAKK